MKRRTVVPLVAGRPAQREAPGPAGAERGEAADHRCVPGHAPRGVLFTETGDTNATSAENPTAGGWGSLFKLGQSSPSSATGKLSVFFKGSQTVTGLDNSRSLARPADRRRGCRRHAARAAQRTRLRLRVGRTLDYSNPQNVPVRWLAEGRDGRRHSTPPTAGSARTTATTRSPEQRLATATRATQGVLGARSRRWGDGSWRWFYTQRRRQPHYGSCRTGATARRSSPTRGLRSVCRPVRGRHRLWCQSTILPSWTRKIAAAWPPGPSQLCWGRSVEPEDASTSVAPRVERRDAAAARERRVPAHGVGVVASTSSPFWTIFAPSAKSQPAASLSLRSRAALQLRATSRPRALVPAAAREREREQRGLPASCR